MKILRTEKIDNYTIIDNGYLKNKKLSFKAKGILTYILSLPDDWVIYIDQMIASSKGGETSFRSGLDELIKQGYVKRYPILDKGQIKGWETEVYECLEEKAKIKVKTLGRENPNQEKVDQGKNKVKKNKEKTSKTTDQAKVNQPLSQNKDLAKGTKIKEVTQETTKEKSLDHGKSTLDLLLASIDENENPVPANEDGQKPNKVSTALLNTNTLTTNNTKDLRNKRTLLAIEKLWLKQNGTLKDEVLGADTTLGALELLDKYGKATMVKAIKNTNRLAYRRKNKISMSWFMKENNFRRAAFMGG